MGQPAIFFLVIAAPAFSLCLALLGLETLGANRLGWFLLALGISYPAGGVIYYFIHRKPFWNAVRAGEAVQAEVNDRSFWTVLPGFIAAMFAPPLEWYYLGAMLPRHLDMEIAGWLAVITGITLAGWARITLKNYYSGRIQVGSHQELVKSGPNRMIRHPAYLGMFLIALGVAVGYSSLIGLLAVLLLLIPGLAYRISVEERLLSSRFGKEFEEYRSRTRKLIPWTW